MISATAKSFRFYHAAVFILVIITGRVIVSGGDLSVFISAGSDFTDKDFVAHNINVNEGQGYDGQFFYRLSLNPFNLSKTAEGITLDYPGYRGQRLIYPLLVWLISFGGQPSAVPFVMILVNVIAFSLTFFFFEKIISKINANDTFRILPLFLFGIYLAVSKDLAEAVELCFFTLTVWTVINKKWMAAIIFSSLTLLTRETSIILLIPFLLTTVFRQKKSGKRLIQFAIPFLLFAVWKVYISSAAGNESTTDGSGNISYPFLGIISGFLVNLNFTEPQKIFQLLFWTGYFIWQVLFTSFVIRATFKMNSFLSVFKDPLSIAYLTWFVFALFLSASIYNDDWSFVRVFSSWNMTGILLLAYMNKVPSMWFIRYSGLLLLLTSIRLIIKA